MEKKLVLSKTEYEEKFKELAPAYSDNNAIIEANRCLYCYEAPCITICPTHINIPTFIKKIASKNFFGAAKTIYSSNWVPLTCAKACPVEELCEGSCVMNEKGEKPIHIGKLQRFAIEYYFDKDLRDMFTAAPKNNKSVGIVGSGPAGLACAAELSILGYKTKVYESNSIPGGLSTWGIAPYKTRQADSLKEIEFIKNLGVKIETGVTVGESLSVDELLDSHDAVFLGIGLGDSRRLKIPGENLENIIGALKYIESIKSEDSQPVFTGRKVAVIGAGNTAVDAATEAKRLGAEEVSIIYRRSETEMPANNFEYRLAKDDGIAFKFLTAPIEFIGESSVEFIKCIKMELGEKDDRGRRRPVPVENSEFEIEADLVILALGQKAKSNFISQLDGVEFEMDKIKVDPVSYQTDNPKIFAGGDCINGGKEVVNAAADGKSAAHGIDGFLRNR